VHDPEKCARFSDKIMRKSKTWSMMISVKSDHV
jgi:hypothetical protein